jgi:mRNA interferase MazF
MDEIKQYDLVIVNLDPTVGSEMKKIRPCVVISPDEMNRNLQTIVIAPITSSIRSYPTRVKINLENTKGWIALDQIRTLDRGRIIKRLDALKNVEIKKVKAIIKETFVD